MKSLVLTLAMCIALCSAALASNPVVQILQPSAGASLDWPFTLQATCSSTGTITGWDVYLDSNSTPYYSNTSSATSLDILVKTTVATHTIQVKCWAGSINGYENVTFDTIGGGLIPMPPSTATPFLNIDDDPLSDWQFCDSVPSCASYAPTSFSLNDVATPSLDGNALAAYAAGDGTPPDYWGILWYNHLGQQDTASNFEVQWSFQVNTGASSQALEFDFPVWDGGKSFYFGTQCNILGSSKVWQYWNPNTGAWVNTTIVCSLSTGAWHTLKWYGTINHTANTYTYSAMQIDNAQHSIAVTLNPASTTYGDNFTVQFQLDGDDAGSAYTEYVDEVSAWTW